MENNKVYNYKFADILKLYIQKVERKGHTAAEVNQVLIWLTGYDQSGIDHAVQEEITLGVFCEEMPALNPNASLIKGVICGHRVEEIEDPFMRKVRYMDKLVDEVAKGKKMEKILRS